MADNKEFAILLVEDSKHDVVSVKRAWKINKISNQLMVVPHGQACMDLLNSVGDYADNNAYPRPGIILMDINMPVMGGIEALKKIREDEKFKTIPVIMLTTSKEDRDKIQSYSSGANTFIQKPLEFEKFAKALNDIRTYWTLSEIPSI